MRIYKFTLLIIMLVFFSCSNSKTSEPVEVKMNASINEKDQNDSNEIYLKLANSCRDGNKQMFMSLFIKGLGKKMLNSFDIMSKFALLSENKESSIETFHYIFDKKAKEDYIDKNHKILDLFYPEITSAFKNIIVKYNEIKFKNFSMLETVVMGRNNSKEDYKIVYLYYKPIKYNGKTYYDFYEYFKDTDLEGSPIASASSMITMRILFNPSSYLKMINEEDVKALVQQRGKILPMLFENPYTINEVSSKPKLLNIGVDIDKSFENVVYQFSYVANSKDKIKEAKEIKEYLDKTFPDYKQFYNAIMFKIYDEVPTSNDAKFQFILVDIND